MKKLIRNIIEKSGYGIISVKALYHLRRKKQISRDDFFNLYFSMIPEDFFFVQIGANDGVSSDPLHQYVVKYNLEGIVVEPQLQVFNLLKKTYENSRVQCINTAIGDGKVMPFYYIDSDRTLLTGLASFQRDVLRKNLNSRKKIPHGTKPDDHIKTINIKTLTFEKLTRDVPKIDFLQIDTEGYDFEILKMLDFNKFSPKIINFESSHLSENDEKECEQMLIAQGYEFFNFGSDTCAYKH